MTISPGGVWGKTLYLPPFVGTPVRLVYCTWKPICQFPTTPDGKFAQFQLLMAPPTNPTNQRRFQVYIELGTE